MPRLSGKVALITGAGSGIGRAAAVLFAQEGAKVVIADIDAAGGAETERQAGDSALFIKTDITDPASVQAAVRQTIERFGKLDVLYNNAGGSTRNDGPVTTAPEEEFWRVIKLDLYGTFLASKFAIPEIIKAGGGSVINTSSNVALMAIPGRDCYTAAKGGVAAMTRSMAVEYAPYKIRVNAIAPSATRTERVMKLMAADEKIQAQAQRHLLGLCEPIHVAYLALYLASDESAVTTGQVIPVDSGITIS
jgi:NAD(P)-dependent dehydrogenase (short-subunit alcohol dehydrogenase family)